MRRSSQSKRNIMLWVLSLILVASMICGLIVSVTSEQGSTSTPVPTSALVSSTSTPTLTPMPTATAAGPMPSPQPLATTSS